MAALSGPRRGADRRAAREDSIQASRTAATSSRPSVRQRLLSRRAPRPRSRPDIISSAASTACDCSSPTPGWNSHQRACHAAATCSKQPGLRSRSPRQTSIPCSSEPRTTALGSGRHGIGVSSAAGARSARGEQFCDSRSICCFQSGCFPTPNYASTKARLTWVQSGIRCMAFGRSVAAVRVRTCRAGKTAALPDA
jgi:hypothetical protein